MSALTIGTLLAWGVVAGIDLVSVLQVMVARPLVAATVAGALVGEPVTGVLVGMMLELFALDALPVGGARYPDCGPAAVAGTVAAARGGPECLTNTPSQPLPLQLASEPAAFLFGTARQPP